MTIGYSEIKFGTQRLDVKNLTKKDVPATIKQKIGGALIKHKIPGRDIREMEISGNGIIFDTSTAATTTRSAIEGLNDLTPHTYTDGLTVATMIMEDLSFPDTGDNPLHYTYTFKMIQFTQTTA